MIRIIILLVVLVLIFSRKVRIVPRFGKEFHPQLSPPIQSVKWSPGFLKLLAFLAVTGITLLYLATR
jgi:hypothetical protein